MKDQMQEWIFFIVKKNKQGIWEYVLDSQLRPTMYRDIKQVKKYAYKFRSGDYRIVEYKLSSTPIQFSDINMLAGGKE